MNVAILGSGKIACDILCKVERSEHLNCTKFIGRNENSEGLKFAAAKGYKVSSRGIQALINNMDSFDLVFDATSASSHLVNAEALENKGKQLINLTPASVGALCVPVINGRKVLNENNINMVTCGGQASLPIIHAISKVHERLEYVEVVSSISSKSAGPATRINLDNYLNTTERAITFFSGCKNTKSILNINPAEPSVSMQTAISVVVEKPNMEEIRRKVKSVTNRIREYLPGYYLTMEPCEYENRVFTMVKVEGQGDYLAQYAGNLDIVTTSAVEIAENFSSTINKAIAY